MEELVVNILQVGYNVKKDIDDVDIKFKKHTDMQRMPSLYNPEDEERHRRTVQYTTGMNWNIQPLTIYLKKESSAGLRMKIKGIDYD